LTATLDVRHLTDEDNAHSSMIDNRGEFSVVEKGHSKLSQAVRRHKAELM
jgi:hypothetical protein